MEILHTVAALREALAGQRISLVPTMGNLHEGHMSLVLAAQQKADPILVSIFVNPLQFGPGEDFLSYPRTLDADLSQLDAKGVKWVFAPPIHQMYPGLAAAPDESPSGKSSAEFFRVAPPKFLSETLEGAVRPGFFSGVATVVLKLFHCIRPKSAFFGQKDYQQSLLIQRMVQDLDMDIHVSSQPTIRLPDGLAYSSRNVYLSDQERQEAPRLYHTIRSLASRTRAKAKAADGVYSVAQLQENFSQAALDLQHRGWRLDYLAIRRKEDLTAPAADAFLNIEELIVLGAGRLGNTRLIDNCPVE